jgi:hypothetical protein
MHCYENILIFITIMIPEVKNIGKLSTIDQWYDISFNTNVLGVHWYENILPTNLLYSEAAY